MKNIKEKLSKVSEKGGGLLAEFKEFAMKGNVIDMAVGVVIGAAFGKIVTSLVNDIIMPLIVAFSIFMMIKLMNSAKKKFEKEEKDAKDAAEEVKVDENTELLKEIRDLLKK